MMRNRLMPRVGRGMVHLVALFFVLFGVACTKDKSPGSAQDVDRDAAMEENLAELQRTLPLPEEVPVPQAIYKQAYQEAMQNMDLEAAGQRLRDIEKSVARERRALLH